MPRARNTGDKPARAAVSSRYRHGNGKTKKEWARVAIRFLSERAIYDDKSDTVRVPAVDGNKLVIFAIARTAIMSRLWSGDGSVAGLIDIYRRHCQAFHALARHKYRTNHTEPDGTVLLVDGDMPVLGAPWPGTRLRALN